MSESLRDRVARVLYEKNPALRWNGEAWPLDEVLDSTQAILAYEQADALIAAGLVVEPEWEYGVRWFGDRSETVEYHDRKPWRTQKAARKVAERKHGDTIERRRTYRPGPWEEVNS